jgi:hypothetical protein
MSLRNQAVPGLLAKCQRFLNLIEIHSVRVLCFELLQLFSCERLLLAEILISAVAG